MFPSSQSGVIIKIKCMHYLCMFTCIAWVWKCEYADVFCISVHVYVCMIANLPGLSFFPLFFFIMFYVFKIIQRVSITEHVPIFSLPWRIASNQSAFFFVCICLFMCMCVFVVCVTVVHGDQNYQHLYFFSYFYNVCSELHVKNYRG